MIRQTWKSGVVLALTALVAGSFAIDAVVADDGGAPAAEAEPAAAPAEQGSLPLPDLGYNAREGRAVYRHYCVTCHGEEGHGDGFNAYNLDPKPRDLSDADFQRRNSDEDLTGVITVGGGAAGLSSSMPPWGRTLNDRQIRNVVRYLRLLKPEAD